MEHYLNSTAQPVKSILLRRIEWAANQIISDEILRNPKHTAY